ncbi:Outer-membrane lipoprotein carrier protein precursor [Delftia tsuruhatensis]|uniref:outer membrane lipoprotein chaperone LolA n=1 Tax=Delftia tsuruhatensis TaxID=180282 RepID=UPI001E7E9620|nr:outer membrane lipoprotein chaperone LolA [Delftia tsuruhatensis]CAB5696029.1 Outer-membrane lipoprotein carrier protein precursor [Delftia tsuruhatensis]CAC9678334.1 Outer-membrane lipoprotein carrier protein precursor [Delftia tsuruhatensis]
MKRLLTAMLIAASATASWADGLKSLEAFMKNSQAGRADFTQAVTAPAKDGQPPRTKNSSGHFEFQRPGKFRFVYTKPFEQTIVADGKTLWLYDADLNQVTQRAQAQALGSTPAAILASASDLKALGADFDLQSAPDQDGLQWVQASPKDRNGQLKSVRVGFAADGQLAALDILDSFGQRSLIRFSQLQTQASLPASTFEFKVPAGADVLKQ